MMASEPPTDAPPEGAEDSGRPADEQRPTGGTEPAVPFPWPPPSGEPVTEAVGRTWRESVFRPTAFFRAMPRGRSGRSLRAALLYYVTLGILVEGIHLFWRFTLGPPSLGTFPGGELLESVGGGTSPVAGFLLAPLYLVLAVFLTSAVSHVILLIVRGATHGFRTTVSVFCFAYGPALFAVVPRLGALIGGIWILVLAIIGLREAHETSGAKAAVAVLGPAFFAFAIAFAILLTMMAGILTRI